MAVILSNRVSYKRLPTNWSSSRVDVDNAADINEECLSKRNCVNCWASPWVLSYESLVADKPKRNISSPSIWTATCIHEGSWSWLGSKRLKPWGSEATISGKSCIKVENIPLTLSKEDSMPPEDDPTIGNQSRLTKLLLCLLTATRKLVKNIRQIHRSGWLRGTVLCYNCGTNCAAL